MPPSEPEPAALERDSSTDQSRTQTWDFDVESDPIPPAHASASATAAAAGGAAQDSDTDALSLLSEIEMWQRTRRTPTASAPNEPSSLEVSAAGSADEPTTAPTDGSVMPHDHAHEHMGCSCAHLSARIPPRDAVPMYFTAQFSPSPHFYANLWCVCVECVVQSPFGCDADCDRHRL
jgi:hypothetical protein